MTTEQQTHAYTVTCNPPHTTSLWALTERYRTQLKFRFWVCSPKYGWLLGVQPKHHSASPNVILQPTTKQRTKGQFLWCTRITLTGQVQIFNRKQNNTLAVTQYHRRWHVHFCSRRRRNYPSLGPRGNVMWHGHLGPSFLRGQLGKLFCIVGWSILPLPGAWFSHKCPRSSR